MVEPDRVLVEILVAAHIDDVWRALRDPVQITRWFGWDYAGLSEEVQMVADAVAGLAPRRPLARHRVLQLSGLEAFERSAGPQSQEIPPIARPVGHASSPHFAPGAQHRRKLPASAATIDREPR